MHKSPFLFLMFALLGMGLLVSCNNDSTTKTPQPKTVEIIKTDTIYLRDTVFVEKSAEPSTYGFPIVSASINIMYLQSGNSISVQVPPEWDIRSIEALDATVIPSRSDGRKFTIVPRGRKTVLDIQASKPDGSPYSWYSSYKVIRPPRPEIQLLVNNKIYKGLEPINKRSQVVVRIKPDADFYSSLPKDARYTISSVDLLTQRSLGAPMKVGSFSGTGESGRKGILIALGNRLMKDPPGTKIYFKVKSVERINYQNQKQLVKFSDQQLILDAIIR